MQRVAPAGVCSVLAVAKQVFNRRCTVMSTQLEDGDKRNRSRKVEGSVSRSWAFGTCALLGWMMAPAGGWKGVRLWSYSAQSVTLDWARG